MLAAALVTVPALTRADPPSKARPFHPQTPEESAAGIIPVNLDFAPGAFRRYGADPTGAADSTTAINAALKSNTVAFDDSPGPARYRITDTLRFNFSGQILRGRGLGDRSSDAPTSLIYSGKPGGKILSVADGRINISDCAVLDLLLDGNKICNIGIEAYDDSIKGGSWRVRISSVSIVNITQGTRPTAIYLGIGSAPNFSNDIIIDGCFISQCGRGVWGAGSLYQISNTTFSGCSESAIVGGTGADDSSSAWTVISCVFSSNLRDFDGTHISQASFSGCWFENSFSGIYRALHAHSACFTGCYLHTLHVDSIMDFGSAAGYYFLGGNFVPANSKSVKIVNVNPTSTGAVLGQRLPLFSSTGAELPPIVLPGSHDTPGSLSRSVTAVLGHGGSTLLQLKSGVFNVGVDVREVGNAKSRTQSTFTAFLCDGDGERVVETSSNNGSTGGQPFNLICGNNRLILTYSGSDTVNASIFLMQPL